MFRRRRTRTPPARSIRARPRGGTPCARGATRAESGHWNICGEREEGASGRVLVANFARAVSGREVRGSSCGSMPSAINGVGSRACVPRCGCDDQACARHLHRDVWAWTSVLRSERQGLHLAPVVPTQVPGVFASQSLSVKTHSEPRSGFPPSPCRRTSRAPPRFPLTSPFVARRDRRGSTAAIAAAFPREPTRGTPRRPMLRGSPRRGRQPDASRCPPRSRSRRPSGRPMSRHPATRRRSGARSA